MTVNLGWYSRWVRRCVRSSTHKNVRRCRRGSWQRSSTGWPKKVSHKVLSISLPNIDRFSNFFHWCILWKICSLIFWPILKVKLCFVRQTFCVCKHKKTILPYRTGQKLSSKLLFIYSPNSDGFYSVATQLRCGGMFSNHFITNFPQNAPVKKFWESVSISQISQRYGQNFVAYFFWATLYVPDFRYSRLVPVSGHDLLQTAGLRSCSAIATRQSDRSSQICSSSGGAMSQRFMLAFNVSL